MIKRGEAEVGVVATPNQHLNHPKDLTPWTETLLALIHTPKPLHHLTRAPPTPGDQINQLYEELMLIHSSVATVYENMVSLDTALEYQGRHEVIISVARQTATVTMSIIQSIYPIVSSMNYKLHVLGGIF
ncbi:hypothetical protein CCMA1212_008842 [Trichoderma ghanense]|uniref:Uncharacterized protein n=1 Tax=Trichoderma ghanense TaxID=65468 RepID=A0ABY2GUS1_9HYPO